MRRLSDLQLAALAALAALLAHARALGHPFVFDDLPGVLDNPSIRDLANLRWIALGSRRPITNFSFAIDWALFGDRAPGWHATNLALHVINVLLAFRLARRLGAASLGAFAAAALLAVHPITVETVGYVSSRPGLLCGAFSLAAVLAWHRALAERRRSWLALALVAWVLAVLSKETALALVVVLVAVDWLVVADDPARRRRRALLVYAPLFVLGAAVAIARLASFFSLEGGFARPDLPKLLTQAEVAWRYVFLFLVPVGQSLVHAIEPVRSPFDPVAWSCVASLLAVLALVLARHTIDPLTSLGALWFLALLAPSSLVPLSQEMAEHRVYEGAFGLFLVGGAQLDRLGARSRLALPLLFAALVALATATVVRHRVWSNPVSLWQDAVEKAPRHWGARYALGDALRMSGDCARAVETYRGAIALRPDELRARRNLGVCLATLGRFDEAERELRAVLAQVPRDPIAYYNLGVALAERGRSDEARTLFLRALEIDPRFRRPCDELRRASPSTVPAVCRSGSE